MPDHDKGRMDDMATEMKGKAQQAAGKMTDDRELKAKGKKNEAKGKLGQAAEDAKDMFRDTADDTRDRPRY
jgi:uncharacterized protein YjbJ (UPF0337 family)